VVVRDGEEVLQLPPLDALAHLQEAHFNICPNVTPKTTIST
jgi:hypothetical protein